MHRQLLLMRVGRTRFALRIEAVGEVMRRLPIAPVDGAPPFVCGLSTIRGRPTPVVDMRAVVEGERGALARLVSLRLPDARPVALGVDHVDGVVPADDAGLERAPPLLAEAAAAAIQEVAALDGDLLLVLEAARLAPTDAVTEARA